MISSPEFKGGPGRLVEGGRAQGIPPTLHLSTAYSIFTIMIVMKFGGTSVENAFAMSRVREIILDEIENAVRSLHSEFFG